MAAPTNTALVKKALANSEPSAALQAATRTIPIVFAALSDPVGSGFAASLGVLIIKRLSHCVPYRHLRKLNTSKGGILTGYVKLVYIGGF